MLLTLVGKNVALIKNVFFIDADHKWSVESLIKNGAYIDCQNLHGDTALHLAAAAGKQKCFVSYWWECKKVPWKFK